MIRKIRIRNFQIHEFLDLELEMVNTFIGPNDAGKTAVIRAIYWLCFGRPLGGTFITTGSESSTCRVGIYSTTDVPIERLLRSGVHSYRINKGKVLKAFGTNVPEEVQRILNVTGINFQRQLDPPFWVMDSGPQIAKNLNEIANLSEMDEAMAQSASRVRSTNSKIEVSRDREKQLTQKVEGLFWVDEFDCDVAHLESLESDVEAAEADLDELDQHIEKISKLEREVDKLSSIPNIDGLLEDMNALAEAEREWKEAENEVAGLSSAISELESLSRQLESYTANLELAQSELEEKTEGRCILCGTKMSSQSVVQTSTCPSNHQSPGLQKRTGSRR